MRKRTEEVIISALRMMVDVLIKLMRQKQEQVCIHSSVHVLHKIGLHVRTNEGTCIV